MSHMQSNAEMDTVTTNKAKGLRWNDRDYDYDDWTCGEYCTIRHEHRYANGKSVNFNFEQEHPCDNNCNEMHQHIRTYRELSQLQKNRNKKGNREMQYANENSGNFTITSYRRRRRPRKSKNNSNQNENQPLRKFTKQSSQESIQKAENEKLVRIESSKNLNIAKKLFDPNESLMVKSMLLDQHRRREAKSKEEIEKEIEKSWADTLGNISNLMFAAGDNLPSAPRKDRMQIKQRYERELSQKMEESIFEIERDEKKEELETIGENRNDILNISIKEREKKRKIDVLEKRGKEDWNKFVSELKAHSDEANGFKARIEEINLILKKTAAIQDKIARKEQISEEEKNEVDVFHRIKLQTELMKIKGNYDKLREDLKLFENEMIDLQKVTKPTLKHFQTMNKIDNRLKRINISESTNNQFNIDYNSLRWDWSRGGWIHKNMEQYQTKVQILNLAAANKIKPRERNQIIIRNIESKVESISEFNKLIDDFIEEMNELAAKENETSIWDELSNFDLVDFKAHIVNFEAYNG